jgi:ubiquinone/menaquinone biosynthesis C-methylase UbiE
MPCVCPWWFAYAFDNGLRRLLHRPEKLFAPYVQEGMTVADLGCGMGFHSIGLARLVGPLGRVIAVDIQPQMLRVMETRARRAGIADRIHPRCCHPGSIELPEAVDFINVFWMIHEVPDGSTFLQQVYAALKVGGRLFIAEPRLHVSEASFERTIEKAQDAGLVLQERPRVGWSRAAVFLKR